MGRGGASNFRFFDEVVVLHGGGGGDRVLRGGGDRVDVLLLERSSAGQGGLGG